jgi:hypothetical protein
MKKIHSFSQVLRVFWTSDFLIFDVKDLWKFHKSNKTLPINYKKNRWIKILYWFQGFTSLSNCTWGSQIRNPCPKAHRSAVSGHSSSLLRPSFFFFSFIIHMCIQGLGHFSPLPPPPPLPPIPPSPSPPYLLNTQQKLFCPYF